MDKMGVLVNRVAFDNLFLFRPWGLPHTNVTSWIVLIAFAPIQNTD
jgi:phage terminase large subunit-like protein